MNQIARTETASLPLVTIAIPTFNRASGYLPLALQSALAQTQKEIEILVGDNASTDSTAQLVESLTDPRVQYIRHRKNIGANGNFNDLLRRARGQWFLLLHDDDLIDIDFVETCLTAVGPNSSCGFIRTGVRTIDQLGETLKEIPNKMIGPSREDFYRSWFQHKSAFYLCNTLYSTEKLRRIGGFRSLHNLLEDNFALVKLLKEWDRCDIEAVKASYRYTGDQRTFSVPVIEWCEDFGVLLDLIVDSSSTEQRQRIRNEANQFFGRLCVARANAIYSPMKRLIARYHVARFFGSKTLRYPWKPPR